MTPTTKNGAAALIISKSMIWTILCILIGAIVAVGVYHFEYRNGVQDREIAKNSADVHAARAEQKLSSDQLGQSIEKNTRVLGKLETILDERLPR